MSIETVKQRVEDDLLQRANVVAVGIAERSGRQVLVVGVTAKLPESQLNPPDVLPRMIEGYEVDVVAIGEPTAQEGANDA
jgi:hypothetical protein